MFGEGGIRCEEMVVRQWEMVGQKVWAKTVASVLRVLVCIVFTQTQGDYSKQMSTINWVERRTKFGTSEGSMNVVHSGGELRRRSFQWQNNDDKVN